MPDARLQVIVRTPHKVVIEIDARSLRVPTETGHVGLRPRMEPLVLAVEPSLVFVRSDTKTVFIGTAGGLLTCDGREVTLMTPLAVVGENEQSIMDELDRLLGQPSEEMQARATLDRLEGEILSEMRRERKETTGRTVHYR